MYFSIHKVEFYTYFAPYNGSAEEGGHKACRQMATNPVFNRKPGAES